MDVYGYLMMLEESLFTQFCKIKINFINLKELEFEDRI